MSAEDVLDRSRDLPQEENALDGTATSYDDDDEVTPDLKKLQSVLNSEAYNKPYKTFFSMLRDFIIEEQEAKTSTMKVRMAV